MCVSTYVGIRVSLRKTERVRNCFRCLLARRTCCGDNVHVVCESFCRLSSTWPESRKSAFQQTEPKPPKNDAMMDTNDELGKKHGLLLTFLQVHLSLCSCPIDQNSSENCGYPDTRCGIWLYCHRSRTIVKDVHLLKVGGVLPG